MKKGKTISILSLLLIGGIFTFNNSQANALEDECYRKNNYDICISEEEYTNLSNLGFTDFEIQNLELEEYNKNKNLKGQLVAETTNYYQTIHYYDRDHELISSEDRMVTEEEYENADSLSMTEASTFGLTTGYLETLTKKMTTTITAVENNHYRYKNTLVWKTLPTTRSYDVIGIGMENDKVYYIGNRTFNQTICSYGTGCKNSSALSFVTNQETGIGVSFKLISGAFYDMSTYLYFDVNKKVDTVTKLYASGDYAHANQEIQAYEADIYNINNLGFRFADGVADKFDRMDTADAVWTGTWN